MLPSKLRCLTPRLTPATLSTISTRIGSPSSRTLSVTSAPAKRGNRTRGANLYEALSQFCITEEDHETLRILAGAEPKMIASREFLLSKALSTLLRHQARNAGIELDAEGFAPLEQVLKWPRIQALDPTVAEIREEVARNAKQRFSMMRNPDPAAQSLSDNDAGYWLIRANQGHSISLASERMYKPITFNNVPPVVVHGTYFAFWPSIVADGGLKRQGRMHVHFGTGVPADNTTKASSSGVSDQVHNVSDETAADKFKVISGMRADSELLIFVDIKKALSDANTFVSSSDSTTAEKGGDIMKWWKSENNVILTEGNADGIVPLKYFKEVRGRRQGVGVLWKDGEKVADLPEGIVARVPKGKGKRGGEGGVSRAGQAGQAGQSEQGGKAGQGGKVGGKKDRWRNRENRSGQEA